MRPVRYLLDLPWWVGLLLFLLGNGITPHYYAFGVPVALFGAWTFSKIVHYDDFPEVGFAFFGFPLFFLVMLIPDRFELETPVLDLLNQVNATVTYATRGALGLFAGLIAFQGVRR